MPKLKTPVSLWDKHHRLAQRQLSAQVEYFNYISSIEPGSRASNRDKMKAKRTIALDNANKAIDYALAAGNFDEAWQTLTLLKDDCFQICSGDEVIEIAKKGADVAKQRWGENSAEFAEELGFLFLAFQHYDPDAAECALLQSVSIFESIGPEIRHLQELDALQEFYCEQGRWAEAEEVQLKTLATRTNFYGPKSAEVQRDIVSYMGILYGLGRNEEARALASSLPEINRRSWIDPVPEFDPQRW